MINFISNLLGLHGTANLISGSALPPGRMSTTSDARSLPSDPGIYRHRDNATGSVDYVGQTGNLRTRNMQHQTSGKFDPNSQTIEYGRCREGTSRDDWCRTERAHIEKHNPPGNTYRGGNGRR